ncbi:MAG: ParB N-terminal domain-containing protein, partial [bacterium]
MRKDTVPSRPKDMMESLTPEQRQAIFQKAKQVEKSARKIEALNQGPKTLQQTKDIIPTGYGMSLSAKQIQEKEQASQLEAQAKKQEQVAQQKKLVKRTAQGTVKKAITTEYGTFDYEASPEESKILELGGQEANDLLVKIANYYRDEFKKQNVPIKESRKGFADLWEAGLNPKSVDVQGQLRTNLKETFAPYTPLLPRLALEKVAGALGSKGQELLQSENMAAKGAGLVTSIGGSIAEDLSNPLATFAYDTGNLYDPTATAEERGGAAFNVVTKYALPLIAPLGATQAGIKAFKAGQTVEQALSTASRALLRSSLGALGRKIDTAVYSKVPLNKLLDVLEAEGQMMGKTRAALSKELATAGKKYAKETGKGVDEFYTKYLNDYADNKAQLTSPGRVPPPIIEPVKAPETPTQVEDLGTVVDELVGKTELVVAEPTLYTPEKYGLLTETDINSKFPKAQKYVGEYEIGENVPNIDSIDSSIGDNEYDNIEYGIRILSTDDFADSIKGINYANAKDVERVNNLAEQIALNKRIDPLIVIRDKEGFYILEGNHRYEAIKKLGIKKFPALLVDDVDSLVEGVETAVKNGEKLSDELLSEYQSSEIVKNSIKPTAPPASIVDEIEQGMGASKSTAPPPPTEPTVTGIAETPDEQFTSAKNRMTQEVRNEYDMGKFDEPTRRAWEESLTTAKQELQSNANAVDNVIAKVESKQAINEAEQSVLVVALSRERRNARALLEQTNNATSPEEIATLAEQTKIAEDRIDNYTNALNRAGSETARTLNARRAVIDAAEDVISIRAKARQTYGKTLEAADEEAITDIGKELEDINKQINDATGKGTT